MTHVTEIGNYTTTTIPTDQLIDVSVPKHSIGGSQGHKRQSLFSRNLATVQSSIGLASSEHDRFKRRRI